MRRSSNPCAPVSASDEAGTPAPDVRLLVPALATWALVAVALGRGPWPALCAAGLSTAGAAGIVWHHQRLARDRVPRARVDRLGRRHPDRQEWEPAEIRRAVTALGLLLSAALFLRVAAVEAAADAGPVAELAADRAMVRITGRVMAEPRRLPQAEAGPPRTVVVLHVERVVARGVTSEVSTPVLLLGGQEWLDIGWRDVVEVSGRLAPAEPGEQVRAVLAARGRPTVRAGPGLVVAAADHVRNRMREVVDPLPPDARGLVPAMIIGDRDAVPEDLADAMTATGMSHLTAVSGTNCSLVVGAAVWVCGLVGVRRRLRPVLGVLVLAAFVVLARPDPSVIRAAVMGGIGLLGLLRSRKPLGMPALAGAILVLLAIDPWLARSLGFALSALATLGLLVFARPWADSVHRRARLPRALAQALAIPLAAQVACAPIVVVLQEEISVVGVLTNALAAPLVAPVTVLGALTALLGLLWPAGATGLAWVASLPASGIAVVARAGERAPLRAIPWPGGLGGALSLGLVLLVIVCAGAAAWRGARRHRRILVLAAVALCLIVVPALVVRTRTGFPGPPAAIVMCDVGQGDAFVVSGSPGRAVVIDAGPDPDLLDRCLDTLQVEVIDAVVLTHFDADHVGGLSGLDRGRPVGDVVVSAASMTDVKPAVERWWREKERPVHVVGQGDRLTWGEVSAVVRGPRRGTGSAASPNAGSLVLDVVVAGASPQDGIRALFLADADAEAGATVRSDLRTHPEAPTDDHAGRDADSARDGFGEDQAFDVVKVAHHGSADHDARLLDLVRAPVALVSVGVDNRYGHPAPTLLSRAQAAGSLIYRTDRDGAVAVRKEQGRLLVVRQRR